MIRAAFTEQYFLTDYRYILENHFYFINAPNCCFKPSLSRIFCINSSKKVFSSQYEGPSTHIFRTSSLCMFIIYRKKVIDFVAKFFFRYFFGPRVIRIICFHEFPDPTVCETKTLNFSKTCTSGRGGPVGHGSPTFFAKEKEKRE